MKPPFHTPSETPVALYRTEDGTVRVSALVQDETLWLTQVAMAVLFDCSPENVIQHLKNIFGDGELDESATAKDFLVVRQEGQRKVSRTLKHYNLDAIIAVGYRVNSKRATQFRIWATGVLREYIVKGFALDDKRLKEAGPGPFGHDYFRELLERVQSIRASERRIWQQITDIFAECSWDYDRNSETARNFFAMVQNKFHFAISGQTAAEIVHARADHEKPHMGLTTWKNAPDGRVLKSDVVVAKNYLPEADIRRLERLVSGFFDYIEDLVERENAFTMDQFAKSVNEFIAFRRYQVLPDNARGKVARVDAEARALGEYEIFNRTQRIDSDFDKLVRASSHPAT